MSKCEVCTGFQKMVSKDYMCQRCVTRLVNDQRVEFPVTYDNVFVVGFGGGLLIAVCLGLIAVWMMIQ